MVRRVAAMLVPLLGLLSGCFSDNHMAVVPDSPFAAPPATVPTKSAFAPAPTDVSARVETLGQSIIAANPQIGARPLFRTIGAPQPEIFHRGTAEIYISEGLVRQCPNEGALAALLTLELGKMVADREALASSRTWDGNSDPPPDAPVGNSSGSYRAGDADQTRLAELAKYRTPTRRGPPPPPPDPESLARIYLQKAGFPATDLDAATPLLRLAASSSALEKSVVNPGPPAPLTR